jgi:hypothetical protein
VLDPVCMGLLLVEKNTSVGGGWFTRLSIGIGSISEFAELLEGSDVNPWAFTLRFGAECISEWLSLDYVRALDQK